MHRIGNDASPVSSIRRLFGRGNTALTKLKIRVRRRLGVLDDVVIVPFASWGTTEVLHVQGRVVESAAVRELRRDDSVLTSLANTVARVESDEIPEALLEVRSGGETIEITADAEGFFRVDVHAGAPFAPGWHHVELELLDSIAGQAGVAARADVLVPDPRSQYLVVSDVDDTVIVSGATDTLRMARLVATKNAHERTLFPGAGALYRAFRAGRSGYPANSIVYVTRSGWNLYDLFARIFEERNIPRGPLLMQDFANVEPPSESFRNQRTKLDWFELLFAEVPLPFVLLGDSGQHDPENFLECAQRWPGRVAAVFIRDVTTRRRDRDVHEIAAAIRALGVPTAVSDSSIELAREAVRLGLIEARAVEAVQRETVVS